MARFHKANLIALLSLSLVACGGGGGDSEPESGSGDGAVPPSSSKLVSGAYVGVVTENLSKYKTINVITPNRITTLDQDGDIFSYRYTVSNNQLQGSGFGYAQDMTAKINLLIKGSIISPLELKLEMSSPGVDDKAQFTAIHALNQSPTLADLEGTYVSEVDGVGSYYLDADGTFYGSDSNCQYSGKFVQADSSAAVFTSSMRIYDCSFEGTYDTTIGYVDNRTIAHFDGNYFNKDPKDMLLMFFENGRFAATSLISKQ